MLALLPIVVLVRAAETRDGPMEPAHRSTDPVAPGEAGGRQLAVGVNAHVGWEDTSDSENRLVIDLLADAGVEWLRFDLAWCVLEADGPGTTDETYLRRIDRAIDHANERGMKVLGVLLCTPGWASGAVGDGLPPLDFDDYGRVAERVSRRWQGRVHAWQVWNEPDPLQPFWEGGQAAYVELLERAHPRIRAGSPDALVVAAGPSSNDPLWFDTFYRLGAADHFDVLSTHTYQQQSDAPPDQHRKGGAWISNLSDLREVMRAHGDESTPLWITEFGWSGHGTVEGQPPWQRGVSPEVQADYLVQMLQMLESRHPYVEAAFWYNARDRIDADRHNNSFGLLERDLSPKPAFIALAEYLQEAEQLPQDSFP